ncbi:MAG: DUF364 domain-containing protein [Anaerolineaceae bacterium]|nr:DUF364 domain-containing protein [Anaerolineaceae bacterium]
MKLIDKVINKLSDARVEQIAAGANWTAVVVEQNDQRLCGLASPPVKDIEYVNKQRDMLKGLEGKSALELVQLIHDADGLLRSVAVAAINAIQPRQPESWTDRNAGEVIAQKGKGKRVALIGHFPFVPDLRDQVGELQVLELRPQDGDFHAKDAPDIIPKADVVAITSMSIVNGTMQGLLDLCSEEAYVIILGPSTPLSPVMFSFGIDMICGSIVEHIDPVVSRVLAGDHFRQVKKAGVRLVTIEKNIS